MRAFRITSTEYQANTPCIFLMVGNEYYGSLIYPRVRNYPQDVDYWRTATCADTDRFFCVEEVEVSESDIESMKEMHARIDRNRAELKEYSGYKPLLTKEEREADEKYNREVEGYNKPFEREIIRTADAISKLIAGFKAVEA